MSSSIRFVAVLGTLSLAAACSPGAKNAADTFTTSATAAAATRTDSTPTAGTSAATATSSAAGTGAQQSSMLDPNSASREQLVAVQGMTATAADALVAGRPYADMVAVNTVLAKHLDEAGRKAVYAKVWKPLDLNTAKGDEILLIPGVGPRMRHEFEEYRPYKNIEQFRREIGKYVDKNEVARLEQYVTIR
jgi:DNA uptake protein ComE-like DNA-binding protein